MKIPNTPFEQNILGLTEPVGWLVPLPLHSDRNKDEINW